MAQTLISGRWQRSEPVPLTRSGYFWAALALQLAFGVRMVWVLLSQPYTAIDDAREHIFWMRRFLEPERFPHDLIADYYASQATPGFLAIYRWLSPLINPLTWNKILPTLLALAAVVGMFTLAEQLFKSRPVAFAASALFTLQMSYTDDVFAGVARSFFYPLFLWFLWALLKAKSRQVFLSVLLQALFYPTAALLSLGVLGLERLPGLSLSMSGSSTANNKSWRVLGLCLVAVGGILLPEVLGSSPFGPAITKAAAMQSPAFGPGGRNEFFVANPIYQYLISKRSGFGLMALYPLVLVLPACLWLFRQRPRLNAVGVRLLTCVALASFGWFLLAYALLFKLYLPNRFVRFSLPLLLCLLGGAALVAFCDWLGARLKLVRGAVVVGLVVPLLLLQVPLTPVQLERGNHPEIYGFLQRQPSDTLLAAFPRDADSLPMFTGLSVLASSIHALAWHPAYGQKMQMRLNDTLDAFYTDSPTLLRNFIDKYGIDFFVVYQHSYQAKRPGILAEPFRSQAYRLQAQHPQPLLKKLAQQQPTLADGDLALVSAATIRGAAPKTKS
ncbi:hypothetical protein [Leptolyngbya sp. FACHB-261]|uniref:hypothetical protein n=1 Tax=Leptolyngbya sp. FACHB-261 TaxID=2692806 RepID=UPI0016876095|nr:hypothetical protein [Leptolyngbya sp. FACHB-261]MBD2103643.1 hypothetical protein [Leptolyngbya sp. FACHB-261]